MLSPGSTHPPTQVGVPFGLPRETGQVSKRRSLARRAAPAHGSSPRPVAGDMIFTIVPITNFIESASAGPPFDARLMGMVGAQIVQPRLLRAPPHMSAAGLQEHICS